MPLTVHALNLRPGDAVCVRPLDEILATLDESGCLGGLPFMPEMARFCGHRVRVSRRADKTCDTIETYKSRRMADAVHLENLRCDGTEHGGCQAGCLLFWKEAWLRRADAGDSAAPPAAARLTQDRLVQLTRRPAASAAELVYVCQATELVRATTPLNWWDPRQYVRELVSGNVGPVSFARTLVRSWFNAIRRRLAVREEPHVPMLHPATRWWDPRPYWWQLSAGRLPLGVLGRALRAAWRRTPAPPAAPAGAQNGKPLGLKPGDRVRVRSVEAIVATLGPNQRHKGLWFDVEMMPFCGREYTVLRRVEQIVDERTGKMMRMKNDCLILEGVACGGCLSRDRLFCPRALYQFWREAWLERVE